MVMYSQEKLDNLKRKKKIYFTVMLTAAAACVAVCVTLCFVVNRDNAELIIALNSVITALCGWFIIGSLVAFFYPCRARIAYSEGILSSQQTVLAGEIKRADEKLTADRYITATQVVIFDGEEHIFYWDNSFGGCPFKAGDKVRLTVCRNYIFAYEAITNEV